MSAMSAMDDWACEHCTWNNTASDLTCTMCYQVRVSTKDTPVLWQWSTGHEWIPYDLDTTLALEAAYQSHQPTLPLTHGFFAHNAGYTVAFHYAAPAASSHGSHSHSRSHGPARHAQTNHGTGMRRQVRRIAADDGEMFVVVGEAEMRQAGRCSICQLELVDEEAEEGEQGGEAAAANDGEQAGGGGGEAVRRAASRQVSGIVKKSGSIGAPQPVQPSTSNAAALAASTIIATSSSSSEASSAPDRVVRLAHCAPGHAFHLSCIASWIKLKDGQPHTVSLAH